MICTIPNFFTVLSEKYLVVIHWSSYSAWRVNSMWSLTYLSMHMVMHYLLFWAEATPPKTHWGLVSLDLSCTSSRAMYGHSAFMIFLLLFVIDASTTQAGSDLYIGFLSAGKRMGKDKCQKPMVTTGKVCLYRNNIFWHLSHSILTHTTERIMWEVIIQIRAGNYFVLLIH